MLKKLKVIEPTLLLDKKKVLRNIQNMSEKARKNGVIFRPHFKTHQSREIGKWFRRFSVEKITASSLNMAIYFAEDGWKDITVAFPLNILEIEKINYLARKISLNLLIESPFSVSILKSNLKNPVNLFIKIDVGYHRTGLNPEDKKTINAILAEIQESKLLKFKGFLTHAGHSYYAKSIEEIKRIHKESVKILNCLKKVYINDFPDLVLSIGDTPTCSIVDNFKGIDEIRPGNFVFYDLKQWKLGVCNLTDIAICMACPVVAKHQERGEIVIYGGGVHFSKDYLIMPDGKKCYGYLVEFKDKGWREPKKCCYLKSLSQEHGIMKVCNYHFKKIEIGSIVGILPVHACLTSNLMKSYLTLNGEIIDRL